MPIPRVRGHAGPALFSYGFRPFFLFGAIWAAAAIPVWLLLLSGVLALPSAFIPRDWHVHELLYGYGCAIVAGFLLTAIPNWTGRLPLQGGPLVVLFLVWCAGRVAVFYSAETGWIAAAGIDAAFLALIVIACLREIVAGRNWRNLKVLIPVTILLAGNLVFHIEAGFRGVAEYGTRLGLAALVMLITLIGGRVIPSFTRNWLVRENPGRLPAPFDKFDAVAIAASVAALLWWCAQPAGAVTASLFLLAGLLQTARLARWAGDRTWADRLVLVLHLGYAFVPAGFLLGAFAAIGYVTPTMSIHAWTAGAIGMMTLAIMTRATLGHTGRQLAASGATQGIYAAAFLSALARICAELHPGATDILITAAGVLWVAAFLGFVLVFGPMLVRPRVASS